MDRLPFASWSSGTARSDARDRRWPMKRQRVSSSHQERTAPAPHQGGTSSDRLLRWAGGAIVRWFAGDGRFQFPGCDHVDGDGVVADRLAGDVRLRRPRCRRASPRRPVRPSPSTRSRRRPERRTESSPRPSSQVPAAACGPAAIRARDTNGFETTQHSPSADAVRARRTAPSAP